MKSPGRGSAKTMEAPAPAGSVAHLFKSEEVADIAGQSIMESSANLVFLEEHLEKIKKRLQDTSSASHKSSLEQELARAKLVIDQKRQLGDVEAQKLIEEEKRRLVLMTKIRIFFASGRCVMHFAWRWEGSQFRCEGGSHCARADELGVSVEDCVKFFSKTGVVDV